VITRFFLGSIISLIPVVVSAQLTLYPIHQSNQEKAVERQKDHLHQMSLPFWDDFSTPTHTDTLWEDKANVWINSGAAIKPPTINVATFDGVNGAGVAYAPNPNQNLDVGPTDVMVSRRIKMTEVPVAGQNDIFLSFYYQWGGSVEPPDANDKLELQFFDKDGNWNLRATFQATALQQPDSFYYYTIRINQAEYIHDDFQFRFQAYGRQSGKFDSWHIDYVYLDKERTDGSPSFPDRSLYTPLSSAFSNYHAIPVKHFFSQQNQSFPSFGLSNLESIPQPMNYKYAVNIQSYSNSVLSLESDFLLKDSVAILPSITPFEKRKIVTDIVPDISNFDSSADSLVVRYTVTLQADDTIRADFSNIDFRFNDTLTSSYTLTDYYAYDDGVAEYAVGLAGNGNVAAYRFEMLTPDPDTINGVYVHFPNSYGTFASTVTFYVWNDDNGRPGDLLLEELVPVQRNSNNEFVLRPFIQSAVVQGTFYIGWQQPSSGRVLIGLDAKNETGDQLYTNTAGVNNPNTWLQNVLIKGSLMIRPRFGPGAVVTDSETPLTKLVSLYPNPNRGEFFIDGEVTRIQIFTTSGYPIAFDAFQEEKNKTRIKLVQPLPGLYIVRYLTGTTLQTQKLIIQE
jgi:hypothetical protein